MNNHGTARIAIIVLVLLAAGVIITVKHRGAARDASRENAAEAMPATAPATTQPGATAGARLPRVVDLGADKCQACKDLAPILQQLKKEYAGRAQVDFIDVWKDPKAGEDYNVRIIPTQIFYNTEGKEFWRHQGFLPKEEFVAKLREAGMK
jgi:thioredoxin 1